MNRKRRLDFAKEYRDKPEHFWYDVIFTDESKYNVFGSDSRREIRWRRPNEALKPINLQATVKHSARDMVWGCITTAGVGGLVFIEGNMNSQHYLRILQDNLVSIAKNYGIESTFKFYQDNDQKHKSQLVQEYSLYTCPKIMNPPEQSPDLNPIENTWDELDRKIRETPISSISELEKRLQTERKALSVDYPRKIVSNMPKPLADVIRNNGYATKY